MTEAEALGYEKFTVQSLYGAEISRYTEFTARTLHPEIRPSPPITETVCVFTFRWSPLLMKVAAEAARTRERGDPVSTALNSLRS